jgi:hypothetical protein
VLYRTKPDSKGRVQEVRIRTITRPTKTRTLRVAGGRRKFQAVAVRKEVREFIVYAPESVKPQSKSSKEYYKHMGKKDKTANTAVTDDELKESLEDLADEEPGTDEDTDDASTNGASAKKGKGKKGKNKVADEDDEPKKKRSGGAAPGKSRAAANGKIGTAEIAAKGKTDARTLRMVLRKHEVAKNPETNRYEWDSWDDKAVKNILKLLKSGEAENVKQEGLQRLKDSKDAKAKTDDTTDAIPTKVKVKKDKKKGKKNK